MKSYCRASLYKELSINSYLGSEVSGIPMQHKSWRAYSILGDPRKSKFNHVEVYVSHKPKLPKLENMQLSFMLLLFPTTSGPLLRHRPRLSFRALHNFRNPCLSLNFCFVVIYFLPGDLFKLNHSRGCSLQILRGRLQIPPKGCLQIPEVPLNSIRFSITSWGFPVQRTMQGQMTPSHLRVWLFFQMKPGTKQKTSIF